MNLFFVLFFGTVLTVLSNPSPVIVTTFEDEDDGALSLTQLEDISLREAILYSEEGATISFADESSAGLPLNAIITLESPLVIERSLNIDASARQSGIIIDGRGNGDDALDFEEDPQSVGSSVTFHENRCLMILGNSGNKPEVLLDNLTVQNGTAFHCGGNIFAYFTNLTVKNCSIKEGRALSLRLFYDPNFPSSHLSFDRYYGGGGLYCYGCDVALEDSVFESNRLNVHQGTSFLENRDTDFSHVEPRLAGAGVNLSNSTVQMTGCRIISNHAEGTSLEHSSDHIYGGGVAVLRNSTATIDQCLVEDNSSHGSQSDGGGIFTSQSQLTLTNSSIINNRTEGGSSDGAGVLLTANRVGLNIIENCTLADNHNADAHGGGISCWSSPLLISHCTIVDNFAPEGHGGGVFAAYTGSSREVFLQNSIVAANSQQQIAFWNETEKISSIGGNVFGSNLVEPDSGILTLSPLDHLSVADPLLLPLGLYGGFGPTRPPAPVSPALNAGVFSLTAHDQHQNSRFHGFPDSGSVEHVSTEDWDSVRDEDWDGDGLSLSTELAIGSDPYSADSLSRLSPFDMRVSDGEALFSAPYSNEAFLGTRWQVSRSPDLVGEFDPIFIYEYGTGLILGDFSSFFRTSDDLFQIEDPNPAEEKAFYRLEVIDAGNAPSD
ncbi:MAG: right-handed parallel beta-helix repeat-containing protein [Roseibacillus sp.]